MARDSHESGGRRSKKRHAGELAGSGALALLLVSFVPEGFLDSFQTNLSGIVLTGGFSSFAKIWNESGATSALLKKAGVGSIVLLLCSGCAIQLGTSKPHEFTGHSGETIIACEVKGISLAFGDGGICQNVEGGHVSEAFSDLFSNTVGMAMQAVAGIFGGIGAMGAGLAPPDPEVASASHSGPSSWEIEPSDFDER